MTQKSILVIGGTSDIGRAIAHAYAADGYGVMLAVRGLAQGQRDADDMRIRYNIQAEARMLDILDLPRHRSFVAELPRLPDIAVCAVGLMFDQKSCENDLAKTEMTLQTNFTAPALLLEIIAAAMAVRGSGTIIGISSVSGDRGRASNYAYGSAKAGFTAYLSGLRNRLARHNVHVMTVKPGFVRTRMTQNMKLPPLLTASPEEVGRAVLRAQKKNRNVIYVRFIWLPIMLIIRHIPEVIFKRLSL